MVEPAPNFEAVPQTRGDVTEDVNFVPGFFGFGELFNQPLELASWISTVDQQPATGEREVVLAYNLSFETTMTNFEKREHLGICSACCMNGIIVVLVV